MDAATGQLFFKWRHSYNGKAAVNIDKSWFSVFLLPLLRVSPTAFLSNTKPENRSKQPGFSVPFAAVARPANSISFQHQT